MSNYTLIQGFHAGNCLLYLPGEKRLFFQSNVRSGQVEYTCYAKLCPDKYKTRKNTQSKCTARVFLTDGNARRNGIRHHCHEDHELIFRDLQTLNAVREKCTKILEWCPLSASKVSAKELLSMELVK